MSFWSKFNTSPTESPSPRSANRSFTTFVHHRTTQTRRERDQRINSHGCEYVLSISRVVRGWTMYFSGCARSRRYNCVRWLVVSNVTSAVGPRALRFSPQEGIPKNTSKFCYAAITVCVGPYPLQLMRFRMSSSRNRYDSTPHRIGIVCHIFSVHS